MCVHIYIYGSDLLLRSKHINLNSLFNKRFTSLKAASLSPCKCEWMQLIPAPVNPAKAPITQCTAFCSDTQCEVIWRLGEFFVDVSVPHLLDWGQAKSSSPEMEQEYIACLQPAEINSWFLPYILLSSSHGFGNGVWHSLIKQCCSVNAKDKLRVALNLQAALGILASVRLSRS